MRSDQNKVTLKRVNLKSAGVYRCEISAEAPLFNTVSRSSEMSVVGKKGDLRHSLTQFDDLKGFFCLQFCQWLVLEYQGASPHTSWETE